MKQRVAGYVSILVFLTPSVIASKSQERLQELKKRRELSCAEPHSSKKHAFSCNGSECSNTGSENRLDANFPDTCRRNVGTLFLPRPQGLNSAVFFNPFLYGCSDCDFPCWTFNAGYRYSQTFKNEQIASCLFGCDRLRFSGSQATVQKARDLMADNFGLSPDFEGQIRFKPSIKNHIIDFSGRYELSQWSECLRGGYFAVNASLVHTIWQLGACERSETSTTHTFSEFPPCSVSAPTPLSSVEAAGDLNTALSGDFLFGDMQSKWRFGRFDLHHARRDTKLANIDFIMGYDFLRCPDYHLGGFIKAVTPTGTKPNAERVFEAIAGNGHHWELGGGLDAHYEIWGRDEHCVTAHLNGAITHLFKNTQWRTFDFRRSTADISGFLSRYVLLKEFDDNGGYADKMINAVNFTTRKVKTSFDIQGDASLRLVYRSCGWAIGIGYNVYGRSSENLSETAPHCSEQNNRRLGIRGVNGVCALEFEEGRGLTGGKFPLTSTSSKARALNTPDLQTLVDNPVQLMGPSDTTFAISWQSPDSAGTPPEDLIIAIDSEIDGQPAPEFVKKADIQFKGVPSQLTHKLFAHIDYQWECEQWAPYCGVGGEVEFPHRGDCSFCTPHQWATWVRAGAYF